jgi:hypothetical protein
MNKKFTLILVLTICFIATYAQKGMVKGFIYDNNDGEVVSFATIRIEGTELGAVSDDQGFFTIPNVPVGTYKIVASYLGYEAQTKDIEVKKNQTVQVKFFMTVTARELQGVEISAQRQQQLTESRVSVTTVTPLEMKRIPSLGGEPDIAQYLQVLPGVVSTGDQGGQIVIRGGTPIQTKFLLDGLTIYNPFHSIGLFSIFETDIIKSVDVYTGGFPAQYGGRISAVVDVKTRDGNRKKFSGKITGGPFLAKALFEIPIIKLKEGKNTSAALILNTRISYLDQTSKTLYKYSEKFTNNLGAPSPLPYSFYDAYGKFSLTSGGNKLNLSGFNFIDKANFAAAKYQWNSWGVGGNFIAAPKNGNILLNIYASYSKYEVKLTEVDGAPRKSSIGGFNVGMDFTNYIKNGEIQYGLNVEGNRTEFEFTNIYKSKIEQSQNTTDLGGFFHVRKYIKRFVFEGGFRFQYYGNIAAVSPEPRVSMKVNATDWFRIKLASGLYSQNFISTKSDRDIVNLFNGFLTGPDASYKFNGKDVNRNMQRSVHAIFGFEIDLPKNVQLNIEPYYKYFWHLFNINRYKQVAADPDFLIEKGDAFGLDISAKWEYKGIYLYGSYSLMFANRNDGLIKYPPHFDRRHNVNLVAAYTFGKKADWEVSTRFNLGSGFPFTKTQSYYEEVGFPDGISSNILGGQGNLGIVYDAKINAGRLPYYHRLDLGIKKVFNIKDKLKIDLNASVANVYNRKNIFYFDRVRYTRINQLPVIPSLTLGISW